MRAATSTGHPDFANDARILKAGLLYADRVRLVSLGSSLTLRVVRDVARSDPEPRGVSKL